MSTSSEANPSTDSRHGIGDSESLPDDAATAELGPGGLQPVDDEELHSWPDAAVKTAPTATAVAGTINAGPDLEIVPDQIQNVGHADVDVVSKSKPDTEPQELAAEEAVSPDALVDSLAQPDASTSRVGDQKPGLKVAVLLNFLLGRIDKAEAARHVVEYHRPMVWMWRRVVGMAFAYILVSITWFLIKLPSSLVADATIPSQVQVATAFHELRVDGLAGATLGAHAGSSLFRFATGLGVGAALGITLGIITGSAPLIRTIVDPVTSFFRLVPGLAVGPLLLIWFGLGEAGLISVVAFSVLWTTMASASDGRTTTVRRGGFGNSGSDTTTVDAVFVGVRSAVLVAWTTMLAIETVAASTGLGAMIWFAQGRSDMVLAGILVVGLIGFAIDTSLRLTHYLITNDVSATAGP